jgi:hypothetical protein
LTNMPQRIHLNASLTSTTTHPNCNLSSPPPNQLPFSSALSVSVELSFTYRPLFPGPVTNFSLHVPQSLWANKSEQTIPRRSNTDFK